MQHIADLAVVSRAFLCFCVVVCSRGRVPPLPQAMGGCWAPQVRPTAATQSCQMAPLALVCGPTGLMVQQLQQPRPPQHHTMRREVVVVVLAPA